jgi:hypothetical protein
VAEPLFVPLKKGLLHRPGMAQLHNAARAGNVQVVPCAAGGCDCWCVPALTAERPRQEVDRVLSMPNGLAPDPNDKDALGRTAMHLAAWAGVPRLAPPVGRLCGRLHARAAARG